MSAVSGRGDLTITVPFLSSHSLNSRWSFTHKRLKKILVSGFNVFEHLPNLKNIHKFTFPYLVYGHFFPLDWGMYFSLPPWRCIFNISKNRLLDFAFSV